MLPVGIGQILCNGPRVFRLRLPKPSGKKGPDLARKRSDIEQDQDEYKLLRRRKDLHLHLGALNAPISQTIL